MHQRQRDQEQRLTTHPGHPRASRAVGTGPFPSQDPGTRRQARGARGEKNGTAIAAPWENGRAEGPHLHLPGALCPSHPPHGCGRAGPERTAAPTALGSGQSGPCRSSARSARGSVTHRTWWQRTVPPAPGKRGRRRPAPPPAALIAPVIGPGRPCRPRPLPGPPQGQSPATPALPGPALPSSAHGEPRSH